MGNLLSMTNFIQLQKMSFRTDKRFRELVIGYANFLQQPLELWMFVPCDDDGNILEMPKANDLNNSFLQMQLDYNKEVKYLIAKEKCLFDGFKYLEGNDKVFHVEHKKDVLGIGFRNGYYKTVENIINDKIKLTPAALIQFT